jgi:hypothetical protein
MADDETPGIPSEELAEEAGAAVTPVPEEELADDGLDGEALADDADERPAAPDEELDEDGLGGGGA